MQSPDIWSDSARASKLGQEIRDIKDIFSKFEKWDNIIDDCNYIPNSHINLRDFQLRIKEEVDDIYSDGRRFAGVVLPTGAGKSFVAMAEIATLPRK